MPAVAEGNEGLDLVRGVGDELGVGVDQEAERSGRDSCLAEAELAGKVWGQLLEAREEGFAFRNASRGREGGLLKEGVFVAFREAEEVDFGLTVYPLANRGVWFAIHLYSRPLQGRTVSLGCRKQSKGVGYWAYELFQSSSGLIILVEGMNLFGNLSRDCNSALYYMHRNRLGTNLSVIISPRSHMYLRSKASEIDSSVVDPVKYFTEIADVQQNCYSVTHSEYLRRFIMPKVLLHVCDFP
jgi:hypothetical protein